MNNHLNKILRGTKVKINENKSDISPSIQKVFTDTSYDTAKSMTDKEKIVFRDILEKTNYYNRIPTKGRLSERDRFIKHELLNDVIRILN